MAKVKARKIINGAVLLLLIVFAFFAISSKFSLGKIRIFTVSSGSMEPTLKTGSMIFVKREAHYAPNDIITFYKSSDSKETITHRLVELKEENGMTYGITQGDANATPDSQRVYDFDIIGKVILAIPYFGYLVEFVRTPTGLIILVIIPATIIIYDEILKIKTEINKKRKGKKFLRS